MCNIGIPSAGAAGTRFRGWPVPTPERSATPADGIWVSNDEEQEQDRVRFSQHMNAVFLPNNI